MVSNTKVLQRLGFRQVEVLADTDRHPSFDATMRHLESRVVHKGHTSQLFQLRLWSL